MWESVGVRPAGGGDSVTRAEARTAVAEYIEVFHNTKLWHSSPGYVTPPEYEQSEYS